MTTTQGRRADRGAAARAAAAVVLGPGTAPVILVAGGGGAGKTEITVNLALALARAGQRVQVADLDLVHPYFRCREARALLEGEGVRVVAPRGAQAFADLPIVLPEIAGLLVPPEGTTTLIDVGGDDVGARVLASLAPLLGRHEFLVVVNARRPFDTSVEACLALCAEVGGAARLRPTGIVSNAHLADETTPEVVVAGWRLADATARALGVPLRFVAVMGDLADAPEVAALEAPVLRMERHMLPPWRRTEGAVHG